MLLSAAWAAELTAILLDPGLLGAAAPAEGQQVAALRDEIEALRADLMVVRTQSLGAPQTASPGAAPSVEAEAAASPSEPASVAAAASPPAADRGGAPPVEVASEQEQEQEPELGAGLGPPELAAGFPDVFEQPATYRLAQGEALLHVAERFGISLEAIVAVNGISDIDNVPVGMLLVLPAVAPALP